MKCPTCNEEMSQVHGFNGFGCGGYVCQNDTCGEDREWCHDCDKGLDACSCDEIEEEEDNESI